MYMFVSFCLLDVANMNSEVTIFYHAPILLNVVY